MGIKTQKIAPKLEDQSLRTFLQQLRDDIQKLSDTIMSIPSFQIQSINVVSGREFSMGKVKGATPITNPTTVKTFTSRTDESGNLLINMTTDKDNVTFVFLVIT